ncbi:hypothetical protein MASR2M12_05760 [Bacteroidales bacterium]
MSEITGKVVRLGQRFTGDGRNGQWIKQELIIETDDQYPKMVCLLCWGERADEAQSFRSGDRIKASVNIESREYNGKWYTDVKVWKFDRDSASQTPTPAPEAMNVPVNEPVTEKYDDDLPF